MIKISEKNFIKFSNEFLVPFYNQCGYERVKKSTGIFIKNSNRILWSPGYSYKINVIPSLSVNFDSIIEFKKAIIKDELSWLRPTVLTGQGERLAKKMNIEFSYQIRYSFDENEFEEVFTDHKSFMEHIGFLFFDSLKTIEQIDSFLNEDAIFPNLMDSQEAMDKWSYNHSFFGSPCDALIAAKLAGNPHLEILLDNYKKLYWQHERELHYISILEKDFLFK